MSDRVISLRNLPSRPPITIGVLLWLLLDRLGVHGWQAGVAWTLFGVLALAATIRWWTQKETTIHELLSRHGDQ